MKTRRDPDELHSDIAGRFEEARARGMYHCPAHDDDKGSLGVKKGDKGVVLRCYAGCKTEDVLEAVGLKFTDLFYETTTNKEAQDVSGDRGEIIKTYNYTDESGVVLYQKVRYEPKGFAQRRPDGRGGWIWGLEGVRRVLYNLPGIQGAERVVFVEGCKDADRLIAEEIVATTVGGASDWTKAAPDLVRQLVEAGARELVVVPDNDAPGRKHMHEVARDCAAAGIAVKILKLEGVPEKGDVSDFLDANPLDKLKALIASAPTWSPEMAAADLKADAKKDDKADGTKPTVCTSGHDDMVKLYDMVLKIVVDKNADAATKKVFERGMALARVRRDDDGRPVIQTLTPQTLAAYMASVIRFSVKKQVFDKMVEVAIHPPKLVAENILARPEWPGISLLRGIVQTPVFLADGTLATTPGYQPSAKLWFDPAPGFVVDMPEQPTAADVAAARDLILDDMLGDFPFADDASRAHAFVFMLVPFCKELIGAVTPNHHFDSPVQGAGKGKLVECGAMMSTGFPAQMASVPEGEDEIRKRITSCLLAGSPYIVWDNISRPLRSDAIAQNLVGQVNGDRILGASDVRNLKNLATWASTGINAQFALDIARRTVVCFLRPLEEEPYMRTGFRHPNLLGWVREHRGRLVSAALTVIRAWVQAGRPVAQHTPMGSFEAWADTMAGVCEVAGVKGFLGNYADTSRAVDADSDAWRGFVKAWGETHREVGVTTQDLAELAQGHGIVAKEYKDGKAPSAVLGNRLGKVKDRRFGDWFIRKGNRSKSGWTWLLEAAPVGAGVGFEARGQSTSRKPSGGDSTEQGSNPTPAPTPQGDHEPLPDDTGAF